MVFPNLKTTIRFCFFLSITFLAWVSLTSFIVSPFDNDVSIDTIAPICNNDKKILKGVDGPYIFRKRNKIREIRVVANESDYEIKELTYPPKEQPSFLCEVENEDKDAFTFQLRNKIKTPKTSYKQPDKVFAISDIEGNFNAFYSLLTSAGIMDTTYNWTYGNGHLVLVGDFVDRGTNVTQCLWLIYKLEQEAEKHGGMVHFILGNHEVLNLQGKANYVDDKYLALAQQLSGKIEDDKAYKYLMSNNRELVRWMRSKNVIERIGKTIFVHGGISPELSSANMSLKEINAFMRSHINTVGFMDENEKGLSDFLFGAVGPLWYRGLLGRYKKLYKKASPEQVTASLKFFQADQVVIGHTVVKEVSSDYNGQVYRIDIGFSPFKFTGKTEGLLIENNQFFRVNDLGDKTLLSEGVLAEGGE